MRTPDGSVVTVATFGGQGEYVARSALGQDAGPAAPAEGCEQRPGP